MARSVHRRGPAADHRREQRVVPAYVQVGLLLAGEAGVLEVLRGRRGADRDRSTAEVRVRPEDLPPQTGRDPAGDEGRGDLLAGLRAAGADQGPDALAQPVGRDEVGVGVGGDHEPVGNRQAGPDELAEVGALAADPVVVRPPDRGQWRDVGHETFPFSFRSVAVGLPPLEECGHLPLPEGEEVAGLGQPLPGRRVRSQRGDPVGEGRGEPLHHRVPPHQGSVPGIGPDAVEVLAGAGQVLAVDQADRRPGSGRRRTPPPRYPGRRSASSEAVSRPESVHSRATKTRAGIRGKPASVSMAASRAVNWPVAHRTRAVTTSLTRFTTFNSF